MEFFFLPQQRNQGIASARHVATGFPYERIGIIAAKFPPSGYPSGHNFANSSLETDLESAHAWCNIAPNIGK